MDAKETLAAYGLTYDDMKVSFVEFAQGIDMMKDGLAEGGIIGLALGASGMQELLLDGKVTLIPITDEALANLRKKNEFLIRRNIPANTYPNQDKPVPTVGTPPDIIIVRDDMPEDLVYQMTKTLYIEPAGRSRGLGAADPVHQGPCPARGPDAHSRITREPRSTLSRWVGSRSRNSFTADLPLSRRPRTCLPGAASFYLIDSNAVSTLRNRRRTLERRLSENNILWHIPR